MKLFKRNTVSAAESKNTEKELPLYISDSDYYMLGARSGEASSMYIVGTEYMLGIKVKRNYEEAVKWFQKAAMLNHGDACYELGRCYENGSGVSIDYKIADEYYEKASQLGSTRAAEYLYMFSCDENRRYAEALPMLTEQCYLHARAAGLLGLYYLEGYGTAIDYDEAFKFCTSAANSGCNFAINNLGVCYHFGYGTAVDKQKALELYKKAGNSGYPLGNSNYWKLEEELLLEEREENYKQALNYYDDGKYALALLYFRKAADQEHIPACRIAGHMLLLGMGTDGSNAQSDRKAALKYIEKAASGKDILAWQYWGYYFETESQIDNKAFNLKMAFRLYKKSVNLGNKHAQKEIDRLKHSLSDTDAFKIAKSAEADSSDYEMAHDFYNLAIDLGSISAYNGLAQLYESGHGVEQNINTALELYKKAADAGHAEGLENYARLLNILEEEQKKSPMYRLNSLTGLSTVKKQVAELVGYMKYHKMLQERDMDLPEMSMHMVFEGNPGTGKTTVARLIGEIYHEIGLLPTATCVEVDRSKLVGDHIGETAILTQKVIDEALGGVLFIDEAYTLSKPDSSIDFGQEAIDTLLKAMEDNRSQLVVIAAGYTDEMQQFIKSNPGLKSRFTTTIHFDDYNASELEEIFYRMLGIHTVTDDACIEVRRICESLYQHRDAHFGNAREIRTFFEKVLRKHAIRVSAMSSVNDTDLLAITQEDILSAEDSL